MQKSFCNSRVRRWIG